MGFRDYAPGLNTFTTRDMYNGALADLGLGADPFTGSRYGFGGGNPISGIEIDGHDLTDWIGDAWEGVKETLSGQGDAPKVWTSDGLKEQTPKTEPVPGVPVSTGDGGDVVGGFVNAAADTVKTGGGAMVWTAAAFGIDPLGSASDWVNEKADADTSTNAYAAGGVLFDIASLAVGGVAAKGAKILTNAGKAADGGGGKLLWTSWQEYPKVGAGGQTYAKIGDRLYSKHAVDRMQPSGLRFSPKPGPDEGGKTGGMPQIYQAGGDYGRSVSPNFVEDVIARTKGMPQQNGNFMHDGGGLKVILSPEGRVVTVMTR